MQLCEAPWSAAARRRLPPASPLRCEPVALRSRSEPVASRLGCEPDGEAASSRRTSGRVAQRHRQSSEKTASSSEMWKLRKAAASCRTLKPRSHAQRYPASGDAQCTARGVSLLQMAVVPFQGALHNVVAVRGVVNHVPLVGINHKLILDAQRLQGVPEFK